MSESMQSQLMKVDELFKQRLFHIPYYQRSYAWEQKQWDDLWEDIHETMLTDVTHFLGTVVLMKQKEPKYNSLGQPQRVYDVVDGQQRLTTLCLFMLALYDFLRKDNYNFSRGIWQDFVEVEENKLSKLTLGGLNNEYFNSLVRAVVQNGELPKAERSTNKRLREGMRRFQVLIDTWRNTEDVHIDKLANCIRENLQVLYFVTENQALAIKTFQAVNDRGKDLSLLDKSKSFLMLYLTRYLSENTEALRSVEDIFGQVFDNYDAVYDLAKKYDIRYLFQTRLGFSEDEFLRYAYHYSFYDLLSRFNLKHSYEYSITPQRIFEKFLKTGCHTLKERPEQLRDFILAWCKDLLAVSNALRQLLSYIDPNNIHKPHRSYKRLFQFQDPSATIYPLLIGAEARGILDQQMLQAISILDLRIYQVRGTDPKAELYNNAVAVMKTDERNNILKSILSFCSKFGSDQELNNYLRGHVFQQTFTKFVLWNYLVTDDEDVDELDYELYSKCQVEHILPQDPSTFDIHTFDFESEEDYEAHKHTFGNLTLLDPEARSGSYLNQAAGNRPPSAKVPYYQKSQLKNIRKLAEIIQNTGFRLDDLNKRTDEIMQFFKSHWSIPTIPEE